MRLAKVSYPKIKAGRVPAAPRYTLQSFLLKKQKRIYVPIAHAGKSSICTN
jgi:hypothetical protein